MEIATQRLDKWLWFTRLVKSRSLASKLIAAGKVRVNRVKITKPSANVKEGDVLTAVIHGRLRVIQVLAPGERRGPAIEAQSLYEDLTPLDDKEKPASSKADQSGKASDMPCHKTSDNGDVVEQAPAPSREKGMGRPTKRDRRKMKAFQEAAL